MATTTACVNAAARDDLIAQRLNRCQLILPLITAAGSLLGALFGGLYTVHNSKVSQADQQRTEWRSALEQVKFDDDGLITSTYLLASYRDTDYDPEARRLQITILQHAIKTGSFDIILQKMLLDAAASKNEDHEEVVTDLLDVDRSLTDRLQASWTNANRNLPPGQSPPSFDEFLQDPTRYFTPARQPELNKTLALIWELDTFSSEMDCIWNSSTSNECPHLSKPLPAAKDMVLLNYDAPNFKTIRATCQVHHSEGQDQYECD